MSKSSRDDTPGDPTESEPVPAGDVGVGGEHGPVSPSRAGAIQPGDTFADYEIIALLGRGAMGSVYSARHKTLQRFVALKVMDQAGAGTSDPQRFLSEARSAAQLDHQNIATVFHSGQADGLLFIEMQLIEGESLSTTLQRGPVHWFEATRYVEQVARVLAHAHSMAIIHRDIKPSNILLQPDGGVKVVDFGIAKAVGDAGALTEPGCVVGTPLYMPPEQWRGEAADPRADLYSLGVTYFHLVTGKPPFEGAEGVVCRLHLDQVAPDAHQVNPAVPVPVATVIARLVAKSPQDRYQNAQDLIVDLNKVQMSSQGDSLGAADRETAKVPGRSTGLGGRAILGRSRATERKGRGAATLWRLWFLFVVVVVGTDSLGWWEQTELRSMDQRFVWRGSAPASGQVSMVLIDDGTVATVGWPLDRDMLVDVIDALRVADVNVVSLDLLVADPGSKPGDSNLADVTADAQNLVHSAYFYRAGPPRVDLPVDLDLRRFSIASDTTGLPEANRAVAPLRGILRDATLLGNTAVAVDSDGMVRRIPLLINFRGDVYPSLSLVTAAAAMGANPSAIRRSGDHEVTIDLSSGDPVSIPVADDATMLISVRGSLEDRQIYSFGEVLELARDPSESARVRLASEFAGKIVLIGNLVSGAGDVDSMPGMRAAALVVAHAMAIETLLAADFLRKTGLEVVLGAVGVLTLAALLVGAVVPRPWTGVVLIGLFGAYCTVVWVSFVWAGLVLPVVAPTLGFLLGAIAGPVRRYREQEQRRRSLAEAFGRYLPGAVLDEILGDPTNLRLGGRRKELSMVSARLHDFGAVSERLEPEEAAEFLQSFFTEIADVIFDWGGTLDRFGGDGIRAFFGDPVPQSDHAERALRCAFEIRRKALAVVAKWNSTGHPRLRIGIGIHTGYVTVGNIGTPRRMEYTTIGRHADIAERLSMKAQDGILVSSRARKLTEHFIRYSTVQGRDLEASEAIAVR